MFRDEASLSSSPALWSAIEHALDRCEHFILLASPQAAASPWVGREAEHWCTPRDRTAEKAGEAKQRRGRMLIALTDGELEWDDARGDFDWRRTSALPPGLRGAFDEEPRHVDFRWARDADDLSLSHPRFREAVADLAAPLHGLPKDELASEEVRQHRRTVRIARGAVLLLATLTATALALAVFALAQRSEAIGQRREAVQQAKTAKSRELAAESSAQLPYDTERALLLGIDAARTKPTAQADHAVRRALADWPVVSVLRGDSDGVVAATFSPDGADVATASWDGTARVWDWRRGNLLAVLRSGRGRVNDAEFDGSGHLLITAEETGGAKVWDWRRKVVVAVLPSRFELESAAFGPHDDLVVTASTDGTVSIWRWRTARPIKVLNVTRKGWARSAAFDSSGKFVVTAEATRLHVSGTGGPEVCSPLSREERNRTTKRCSAATTGWSRQWARMDWRACGRGDARVSSHCCVGIAAGPRAWLSARTTICC